MKEKKKFNYSTLFLILAIIIIAIMGYFLYKIYNENSTNKNKLLQLSTEISNLKEEVSITHNNSDTTIDSENTVSKNDINTEFYGVYTSPDKIYKYVFLPNGEMCYINNNTSNYTVLPGTYYIENNILYHSSSNMIKWFGEISQVSYFKIIDRNTLEYNNKSYTRETSEKLSGTYSTVDATLILDNNGNFELSAYGSDSQEGTYVINDDILKLNNESQENNSDMIEITYLVLDKNTIVAQWEINGKLYYNAYIK